MTNNLKYLLLSLIMLPYMVHAQKKSYTAGDAFSYRLTTESFKNGEPDTKSMAISWHTVVEKNGKAGEQVRWLSKTVYTKNDTLNNDHVAQKVNPYIIFPLLAEGLKLPALTIPEMTGEITDLHTFYVAVSPALHIDRLNNKQPYFKDSVLHGKFDDGIQIIKGEDKVQVTQKLLEQTRKHKVVETSFTPPAQLSIVPLIDTIGKQTFNFPNNFQMIRRGNGDKVNLLWGIEEFIITSTIDKKTGLVLHATMVNTLQLRLRYNTSADLQTYDAEIPLTIKRIVQLELMK